MKPNTDNQTNTFTAAAIEPMPMLPAVEINGFDCIYGSTVRIWVTIAGIKFKRIWDRSGCHRPIWDDIDAVFGNVNMEKEKELELEAIFKAFCLETNFNIENLLQINSR